MRKGRYVNKIEETHTHTPPVKPHSIVLRLHPDGAIVFLHCESPIANRRRKACARMPTVRARVLNCEASQKTRNSRNDIDSVTICLYEDHFAIVAKWAP